MSATVLSVVGTPTTNRNPGQYHTLSDGSGVAIHRSSSTQVTFRHTTDHVNYTLKNTLTPASWGTGKLHGATIDESDNIHFCWIDSSNSIKYILFTKSAGPTWTAGSTETVGSTTLGLFTAPSVEAGASGTVLVAWSEYSSSLPTINLVTRFRFRHTGGAWAAEHSETNTLSGGLSAMTPRPPSIARDSAGAVAGAQKFAFMMSGAQGAGGTIIPCRIGVKTITVATGAVTATTIIDAAALGGANGNSVESFGVFTAGTGVWHGGGSVLIGSTRTYFAFEFSATGYLAGPDSTGMAAPAILAAGLSYVANRLAFVEVETSGGVLKVKHAAFGDGSGGVGVTFLSRYIWDSSLGISSVSLILCGQNRNGSYAQGNVVIYDSSGTVSAKSNPANAQTTTMNGPLTGAVVGTNNVELFSNPYETGDRMQKPRYEISTSAVFATSSFLEGPNSTYKVRPVGSGISLPATIAPNGTFVQGSWYVRARAVDPWGKLGPSSSSVSFTVSHVPFGAVVAPEANKSTPYASTTEIAWTFLDSWASDFQSAYQVVIERNDTGAVVLDTGKVVAAGGGSGSRNSHTASISSTLKDVALRVKVAVWDAQDIGGLFSTYTVFTLSDPPVVTITGPPAGVLTNPTPTITWTFSADGGRVQSAFQVVIAKVDGTVVHDSGTVGGAATSYTPAISLANSIDYIITVRVYDNSPSALQDTDTRSISTAWTPAADTTSATIDISEYSTGGYVRITWTNATKDADFYSWQVWRTDGITGVATLIHETRSEASTFAFNDYLVANERPYRYDVIQTAMRFGAVVPSPLGSLAQLVVAAGALVQDDYWLIYEHDPSYNVPLHKVKDDKFVENEVETEEIQLVGRGRKVDYGTALGPKGSLTAQIWDWFNPTTGLVETAREQRQRVADLKALRATVYLRNPFGDLWMVAMGNVDVSRLAGVGNREFVDITVPYTGVS